MALCESLNHAGELEAVGGRAYVYGLTDGVPHSTNAAEYARIVRERARRRKLVFLGQKLVAEAYESEQPSADLLDRAQAALFQVAGCQTGNGFVNMKTLMRDVVEEFERLVADQRSVTGVPSGLPALDDLRRGFQKGDLVVIAAPTSVGKTSLVQSIAQYVALEAGRRVAVFSLEMDPRSLGLRLLASEAHVDHHQLLTGRLYQGDYARMSAALERLSVAGIYIDSSSALTAFDVRAKARRLKADGALDLIVIDYLQLMRSTKRAENRNLEVAEISRALKAVAIDLDVPVLLLSHFSRAPETRTNHRPQLSDLRDSGAIEQDADVVLLLYREERYAPTDQNRGVAEIDIGKQRNGPVGTVKVSFVKEYTRFEDLKIKG
jgi:replicative DNA helicase